MTTTIDRRATPPMGQVIREQFSATVLLIRPYIFIAGILGAVATFLALTDYFLRGVGVEFAPEQSMITAIAAVILAIVLWQKERHFGAGFLWTLPVDRRRHAFAKMFAGWLCLMIAAAALVLWMLILSLFTKGNITSDEIVRLLPTPEIPAPLTLAPSALKTIRWVPQPIFWLVPFTAATAAYILASAIMFGLRYPFRWIIGAIAGAFLVAAIAQGVDSEAFWTNLRRVMDTIGQGRYGLDAVLSARNQSVRTEILLANGVSTRVWTALPLVSDWIIATLLWTGLGSAGLLAALHRHREQR